MITLAAPRLVSQQIAGRRLSTPAEVVAHLGALQAQDYAGAKWAVGLRVADEVTDAIVERAIDEGTILRTHAMRGTWQLILPADVRWMLALVAPRIIASAARRYEQLDLDAATLRRSNATLARVLADGRHRTRKELAEALSKARIPPDGQRLSHLLLRAELDGVVCNGARRGKQSTHTLLDMRAPPSPLLDRRDAVSKLAARYFVSRGPATVHDFAWWSGLPVTEVRVGLEAVRPTLESVTRGKQTYWLAPELPRLESTEAHLLPPFDEFLVAYRDRDAQLDPEHVAHINAGGGLLDACVVVDGRVIGTWKRALASTSVALEVAFFDEPRRAHRARIDAATARYARFLGLRLDSGVHA